jgi:endonuclease/exonuclease/phosphatase family metal-dependent hydrolase
MSQRLAAIVVLDGRGLLGFPLTSGAVLVATAVLMLAGLLVTTRELVPRPHRPGRTDLLSLVAVFGIPAALLVGTVPALVQPAAVTVDSSGLRVVTYNVGLAFDLDGRLNLDGVARTLERMGPDVVSLQEVPRGHLPTGGVDMLGWLQRRLDLPYVAFQPSAPDALHGNAILSRYPIREVGQTEFPRVGTSLPRGALAVEVELDGFEPVVVIGTHLPPGGTLGVRAERVDGVLDLWAGRPRTIIAADLNSQPGSDILRRFDDAGWVSAWDTDDGPGYTFPADQPVARIDWVLTTPDLVVLEAQVVPSRASDHRPLLAWSSSTEPGRAQLVIPPKPTMPLASSISPMWRNPCWYIQHSIPSSTVMPSSPATRAL